MVRVRLVRVGAANAPRFRIVVTPVGTKRNGKFLEILGYLNPAEKKNKFKINFERYNYWLGHGAQPSKAVLKLVGIFWEKQDAAG